MLPEEVCRRARALIATRLGLDLPERRRPELERGVLRASQDSPCPSPASYLAWLETLADGDPGWGRLAGHLTVGETYFFRDGACFEALERHVLPSLIAARRFEGTLRLRLWSAGCATGEEPYSLAILLDRLLPDRADWALTVLATDINPEALEAAQRGLYREWSLRETPPQVRERYFRRLGGGTFELDPDVRRAVTFAPLNLAADVYPAAETNTGAMDVILSRNVFMYFTLEAQRAAIARLQRALAPGGWLALSPVEATAALLRPLVSVRFPGAVFYRKEPTRGWGPGVGEQEELADIQQPVPGAALAGAATWAAEERSADLQTPPPVPPPPASETRPEASLLHARALADQGKLEEARRVCEAAMARDRLEPEAHILLAAICQEQGDLPAALKALERAIYLAPDSAPAHFLLGSLLLRRGDRPRARRCMENVVDILRSVPPEEVVAGSGGLAAGRLLETARAYLAVSHQPSAVSRTLGQDG